MKNLLRPAIAVRLVVIFLLLAATAVMSHRPSADRASDAYAWWTKPHTDVPAATQHSTAVHEAAHVVASVALRGVGSAEDVKVYAGAPFDGKDTLYGRSATDVSIGEHSRIDALRVAAMFYAGGTAERVLLFKDTESDRADGQMASMVLVAARTGVTPADGAAATNEALKSEASTMGLLADINAAGICAKAVVQKNDAVIRLLADEIIRQPVHFGRHFMDRDELQAFFAAHAVTTPSPECDFTE